jgi:very-short-patch-repair endonuclease
MSRGLVMSARHASCALGLRSARIRADLVEVLMFGRALVSHAHARLLEERARVMRFAPTRSEEWLWRRLSGSKTGFAFRRQLVIGLHIVDFACTKVRLVVEVDGEYHEERARHDSARDRALNALGWCVVRVHEQQVLGELDAVVASISESARRLAAAKQ